MAATIKDVARGAQDAANRAGFDLILCNADLDSEAQLRYVRAMVGKRVDGLIMNSVMAFTRAETEELAACGVPVVLLNRPRQTKAFSTVCADNREGGWLAGDYLRRLGHRRVARLTGPKRHGNLTDRAESFVKTCPEAVVLHGEHISMAQESFERHPKVTAVFAASDVIAFGVIRTAWMKGLRVPAGISVIGFDNVEISGIIHPPLTTIHQPKYEMGEAAVEMLIKSAREGETRMAESRILGVRLIERESCRPIQRREEPAP